MFRCSRKSLFLFSVWTAFCIVALPVFAQTPATGSMASSNEWTPAIWVSLVGSISSIIVAVLGWLKSTAAQKKATENASGLNANRGDLISLIVQLSQKQPTELGDLVNILPQEQPEAAGARLAGVGMTDNERKVLKALTEATVPLRSISGISNDTKLPVSEVEKCLAGLDAKELAAKVQGKTGIRWAITPAGRKHLEAS